jgi:hypothetical protein
MAAQVGVDSAPGLPRSPSKVIEPVVEPVVEPAVQPAKEERRPTFPTPPDSPIPDDSVPPAYGVGVTDPGGPQPKARAKLDAYMYSGSEKRYPRISRPVELLRAEYDVVVIGSGYGGGVAASRMARGGQRVCVLELGKERWRKSAAWPRFWASCSRAAAS